MFATAGPVRTAASARVPVRLTLVFPSAVCTMPTRPVVLVAVVVDVTCVAANVDAIAGFAASATKAAVDVAIEPVCPAAAAVADGTIVGGKAVVVVSELLLVVVLDPFNSWTPFETIAGDVAFFAIKPFDKTAPCVVRPNENAPV